MAVVQTAPGAEVTPDELTALCRRHVAAYKVPEEIRVTDALPRGPLGKVSRRDVALLIG